MRKLLSILSLILLMGAITTPFSSCRTGYGCPAEEEYKKSKEKPLTTKRGKTRLFKKK